MKLLILFYFFFQLSLIWEAASFPSKYSIPATPHLDNRALSEVNEGIKCSVSPSNIIIQRNGIISPDEKWTNFVIYIDPSYSDDDRILINNAAYRLSRSVPCVRFGIWDKGEDPQGYNETYIHIVKSGSGCWSYVGKKMVSGPQQMSLDPDCMTIGTIMHEMIHALGLDHEQSRPDRDDYVIIMSENILPDLELAFEKLSYDEWTTFGIPYNTRSLMHYSSYDASSNGEPTILTKAGEIIQNNNQLQWTDIMKLNMMYQC